MSLFTFKELWSVECNEGFSAFSSKSLVEANIDNSTDGSIKFVLGSLTGVLRIIGPNFNQNTSDNKVCVLAELNLGAPILQIEADVFIGGTSEISLAILHPFKLGVYSVSKLIGQVDHGSQYKVSLLYEHQLKRHAFNMCCGPFGHGPVENKEDLSKRPKRRFICVQSLDGTLSFFEQELATFCRFLPGFLLPGQLAYAPSWDSFLTVTSWNLVCFKYTSLAMAKDDPYQQQFQDTTVGKRLSPDWSFSIGEECIGDIQILSTDDAATSCVVVSTFRNIMCFGQGGILVWIKRLDYQLTYFHSFLVPISEKEHECITVTTSSNDPSTCYVYSGTTLRWAAKIPFSPIYLNRIVNQEDLKGCIIALSTDGSVVLGCLGTVPSLFVAAPVQARDLDYEAAEIELNNLRRAINSAGDQEVTANKDSNVEIKLEFEGQKTKWIETNGLEVMSLVGVLKLVCHLKVNDVRVTFNTPNPIICSPESVYVGDIIGRHSYPVELYSESEAIPSDLKCDVFVFYTQDNGSPHFIHKCGIRIPLFIVAKPHHRLEKDGDAKLTFSVNKPVVNLLSLYNDFHWELEGNNVPGISFSLCSGELVSLLSSTKNASSEISKYRIQSQSLAAIFLIFRDFIDRVQRKMGREKGDLIVEPLGFDEEMTLLNEYFQEIDAHAMQRQRDAQIKNEISDRAAQLRAIQRRLLIRFRDKNPLPLTQLEILFDGSLDQVGDCLNFIAGNDMEMQKTECRLSGATKLLLELIKLKRNSLEDPLPIFNALSSDVWDFSEEYGWEESVYTALTFIKGGVVVNQPLANLDLAKLKRAIKSSVEKAWKVSGNITKSDVPQISSQPQEDAEPEKLIGNEIQERMTSARARSARTSTSRRMTSTLASIPEPEETLLTSESNKEHPQMFEHSSASQPKAQKITGEINLKQLNVVNEGAGVVIGNGHEEINDDNFW